MSNRIKKTVVILFWIGMFCALVNLIGAGILPVFESFGRGDSGYMLFLDNSILIGGIVWLGGLWSGLCGLISLLLKALARRSGYPVDLPRYYVWLPLGYGIFWVNAIWLIMSRA